MAGPLPVRELRDRHPGQVAYIVGRGRSLLRLTHDDFPDPGPVIALNSAILQVRRLELLNPIYSMQQDGCLVRPLASETLLVSDHLSRDCWPDHPHRYLFRIAAESSMSTPVAVRIAILMGVSALEMLGMDAYTAGSQVTVAGNGKLEDGTASFPGYVQGAQQAETIAAGFGIPIRWQSPDRR